MCAFERYDGEGILCVTSKTEGRADPGSGDGDDRGGKHQCYMISRQEEFRVGQELSSELSCLLLRTNMMAFDDGV